MISAIMGIAAAIGVSGITVVVKKECENDGKGKID